MTPIQQKETAERLGELLAQSMLDEEVKELILDGVDDLPESLVMNLLSALEEENDQVEKASSDIQKFLSGQETRWEEVEDEQKNLADDFIEQTSQTLDDEVQIQELKESIT